MAPWIALSPLSRQPNGPSTSWNCSPRHRATGTSLYWGGWPNNRAGFLAAREKADPEWIFREYLGNVDNLSAINRAKYRYVGFAFRMTFLNKCDEAERATVAEYYQRCFNEEVSTGLLGHR